MPDPIDAVIGAIKACKSAKDRAVQNKKRCEYLVEQVVSVEHILKKIKDKMHGPLLFTSGPSPATRNIYDEIGRVIDEAWRLIQKQSER